MANTNIINEFRGEYRFLSNFYAARIEYDGITYDNSEAAFQAQKCANKLDRERFATMGASDAKRAGRGVALRKDWESVKLRIMSEIVTAKFEQNPELMKKLIDTGDATLEEGNTWGDRYWGTVNGYGSNHLGKILMSVRDKLRQCPYDKN